MSPSLKSQLQDSIPQGVVRTHLKLLGAFCHLVERVTHGQLGNDRTLDEFFQRATYRLHLWVENIIKDGDEKQQPLWDYELPPLDVALALHALMLSPHRYFEDSELRFRQLKRMKEYPLAMVVAALDADHRGYEALKCQPASEYWQKHTGLDFDAVTSMQDDAARVIACPACQEAAEVPWTGDRGFAGGAFQHQCRGCGTVVTHEVLRAGKFLKALNQAREDPRLCLPNTAILIRGELDVRTRCAGIINEVWGCFETQDGRCQSLEDVVAAAAIESSSIMMYIAKRLSQPNLDLITASVPVLLRAFEHSYPFTQDIVKALCCEHQFIQTLYLEGWLRPDSGGPNDDDLEAAFAMYADFLERAINEESREPGWQADLIWHTHQLNPGQYRGDSMRYNQVFLDHLPRGEDDWLACPTPRIVVISVHGNNICRTKGTMRSRVGDWISDSGSGNSGNNKYGEDTGGSNSGDTNGGSSGGDTGGSDGGGQTGGGSNGGTSTGTCQSPKILSLFLKSEPVYHI